MNPSSFCAPRKSRGPQMRESALPALVATGILILARFAVAGGPKAAKPAGGFFLSCGGMVRRGKSARTHARAH